LLLQRICDLSLEIRGSRLEPLVAELYQNLDEAGISFRPATYLSDEWGCPNGVPIIGIPFYYADPELSELFGQLTGFEAVEETELIRYLRHEAGHAFNYAHRLYTENEWQLLFGQFSLPYDDDFTPAPFSLKFVRHMPGWYAQKHPDEDFAETFAVWLAPGSDWRTRYEDTPALAKLMYVHRLAREYGRRPTVVTGGKLDVPRSELTMTLREWYEAYREAGHLVFDLHRTLDNDLRMLFPASRGMPAEDFLLANRSALIRGVSRWTGLNRRFLGSLFDSLLVRIKSLDLKLDTEQTTAHTASVSAFLTTAAMNYIHHGRFVDT